MRWTQEQIKVAADTHRERIRDLQTDIEVERCKWNAVQARCRHPNRYSTSCMGDSGERCPDCGWGR